MKRTDSEVEERIQRSQRRNTIERALNFVAGCISAEGGLLELQILPSDRMIISLSGERLNFSEIEKSQFSAIEKNEMQSENWFDLLQIARHSSLLIKGEEFQLNWKFRGSSLVGKKVIPYNGFMKLEIRMDFGDQSEWKEEFSKENLSEILHKIKIDHPGLKFVI